VRQLPTAVADRVSSLLMRVHFGASGDADRFFPPHLPRWTASKEGRVPTVDKHGLLLQALESRRLRIHGPVAAAGSDSVSFEDSPGVTGVPLNISMVILCTGYDESVPEFAVRASPGQGVFKVGFSNPRLLPLRTIGEEAADVAEQTEAFLGCGISGE